MQRFKEILLCFILVSAIFGCSRLPEPHYPDPPADPAALNLQASNGIYVNKVALSWSIDETGNAVYRVFRSDSPDGSYEQIAEPTATSYDDTSVQPGKPYYYKVQGISSLGNPGTVSSYDNGFASLPAPVLSVSKGTYTSKIQIQWQAVPNAATYTLFRASTLNGLYSVIYSGSASSYADAGSEVTGQNIGTDFYYKATATSAYALEGFAGDIDSGYVFISVPSGLTASSGTFFSIVLNWTAVADASSYRVYRLRGSEYSFIASSSMASYNDLTAAAGQHYSYRVSAIRGGHETALSSAATGMAKEPAKKVCYRVHWNASRQKAVNRAGGGYRVYCSKSSDFSSSLIQDVPYESGDHAPTAKVLEFAFDQKGTWHVKVTAYSSLAGGKESPASNPISVKVE